MNQFNPDALDKTMAGQPASFQKLEPKEEVRLDDPRLEPTTQAELDTLDRNLTMRLKMLDNTVSDTEAEKIVNMLKKPWFRIWTDKRDTEADRETAIKYTANLIENLDEDDLLNFVKNLKIHRTLLFSVLENWSSPEEFALKSLSDEFRKLVKVMTDCGFIEFEVDKKLVGGLEENEVRFTALLRKAENILKSQTLDEILALIKNGSYHPSIFKHLLVFHKDQEMVFDKKLKDKLVELVSQQVKYAPYFEVEESVLSLDSRKINDSLIERNKFDYDKLKELLDLYVKGERKDPGGCKQKIQDIMALEIMKGTN